MTKFKIMAFHHSTGLWDRHIQIKLEQVIGRSNETLAAEVEEWQAVYDDQFRKYTYEFDWETFNHRGRELTAKIQACAPANIEVYYVESDDRDFFNPEECSSSLSRNGFRQLVKSDM